MAWRRWSGEAMVVAVMRARTVTRVAIWMRPEHYGGHVTHPETSAVVDLSTVRFEQIEPPELDERGHPDLVAAWESFHREEVHRLENAPDRWNGPILFAHQLGRDRDGLVLHYFVGDYAAIGAAQSCSALLDPATAPENVGSLLDNGLSLCVAVVCRDGWIATRRSTRVHGSGRWQLAAAEGLELADMTGGDPVRQATRRALREELDIESDHIRPWVLERLTLTGRSFRLYSIVELPDLGLSEIASRRESAVDVWETDELQAFSARQLQDLPMFRRILVPQLDVR